MLARETKENIQLIGDATNSWVGAALLHEFFVREHNAVADTVAKAHPDFDDERIYQVDLEQDGLHSRRLETPLPRTGRAHPRRPIRLQVLCGMANIDHVRKYLASFGGSQRMNVT
jgi:hypothetical protein